MRIVFPVQAPPEAWAALADPRRLEAALPGCRSVTRGASGDGDRGGVASGTAGAGASGTGRPRGGDSRSGGDAAAGAAGGGTGTLHVVTEVAVASVRGLWAGTVERVDAGARIAGADAGRAGGAAGAAGAGRAGWAPGAAEAAGAAAAAGAGVRVRGSGTPGTVDVVVRVDPDRTAVTVEGTVEGPLATVGSTVLAAAVRRMAEDLLAAAALAADPGTTGDLTAGVADPRPDARRRRLRVLAGALVVGGAAALGRRLVRRGAA